jgi:hypothetical protein
MAADNRSLCLQFEVLMRPKKQGNHKDAEPGSREQKKKGAGGSEPPASPDC